MTETKITPSLKTKFKDEVVPALQEQIGRAHV